MSLVRTVSGTEPLAVSQGAMTCPRSSADYLRPFSQIPSMVDGIKFQTTFGFQTTSGFDVPRTSASDASAIPGPARSSLSASPALRVVVPELHSGKIRPMSGNVAPAVADLSSSVGWKGLLEMSRTSGAAGVVGVQRSVGIAWELVMQPYTHGRRSYIHMHGRRSYAWEKMKTGYRISCYICPF